MRFFVRKSVDTSDVVYRPKTLYRATGVVLSDLREEGEAQLDLFGEVLRAARIRHVYEAVDQLDAKYGKHTVFLGSSFAAVQGTQHAGERAKRPRRRQRLLKGEGERKRLGSRFSVRCSEHACSARHEAS